MGRSDYRQLVTLVGPPVVTTPDGQGGYTQTLTALTPSWYCAIRPASQRDLERTTSGTTITSATHLVEGDYRADITTATQLLFNGRTLFVNDVRNVDERNITLILACSEVVS